MIKELINFWIRAVPQACRLSFGLWLLLMLEPAGSCAATEIHAVKSRGVYTTLFTPEIAPLASFTMPAAGYVQHDNFGPDEIPLAVVVDDLGGVYMTLELRDLISGETLLSKEFQIIAGRAVVQPLLINQSGEYQVRVLLRGAELDSFKFSVMRQPMRTSEGKVNYDAVISYANALLKLDSSDALAYNVRGSAYAAKGAMDDAIGDYSEAIRLRPKDATAYVLRALIYEKKMELDKAIGDLSEFIRLRPSDPRGRLMRAVILEKHGSWENAIGDLHDALHINPEYARPNNELAWILATCPRQDSRNGKGAITLATKACELSTWKKSQFIDTLAAAYAEVGNFESAVEYQKQVLKGHDFPETKREKYQQRLSLYELKEQYHQPEAHSGQK
jgi:tetratricopeptide (TPR) repeat protein